MIRDRLLQYLEYKGVSKYQFYKDTGLSNGFLDKTGSIGSDKCEKICYQYPDINLYWLITGDGNMIKEKETALQMTEPSIEYLKKLKTDRKQELQIIPLYSIEATAGVVDLLSDSKKHIPIDFISIPNLPKCDGALPITGDSMYPLLKSGDMVLYKEVHDKENIIWGEMYLVAITNKGDDFFFAKYIQRADRDGWIKLVSQNPNHQPVEFPLNSVTALALIKASIRINTPF